MNPAEDQAVYRLRKSFRKADRPAKYQGTFELTDDRTQQVMAACDLVGRAVFSTLVITDSDHQSWQMKPNRKIMPSRWGITDPAGQIAIQFDQKILGKLTNPLYRVALTLLDAEGHERYRLVDPNTNIPDRVLGLSPERWSLLEGEKPVARLAWLPRQKAPPTGFLGKLRKWLAGGDQAIVSAGPSHVLPAPVALGLIMIFNELRNTSGE